ncbi:hypothetical protein ACOME3_003286 [Neoechinorhynchus agilis]
MSCLFCFMRPRRKTSKKSSKTVSPKPSKQQNNQTSTSKVSSTTGYLHYSDRSPSKVKCTAVQRRSTFTVVEERTRSVVSSSTCNRSRGFTSFSKTTFHRSSIVKDLHSPWRVRYKSTLRRPEPSIPPTSSLSLNFKENTYRLIPFQSSKSCYVSLPRIGSEFSAFTPFQPSRRNVSDPVRSSNLTDFQSYGDGMSQSTQSFGDGSSKPPSQLRLVHANSIENRYRQDSGGASISSSNNRIYSPTNRRTSGSLLSVNTGSNFSSEWTKRSDSILSRESCGLFPNELNISEIERDSRNSSFVDSSSSYTSLPSLCNNNLLSYQPHYYPSNFIAPNENAETTKTRDIASAVMFNRFQETVL